MSVVFTSCLAIARNINHLCRRLANTQFFRRIFDFPHILLWYLAQGGQIADLDERAGLLLA